MVEKKDNVSGGRKEWVEPSVRQFSAGAAEAAQELGIDDGGPAASLQNRS